jgi:hypothetical protein
MRKINIICPVCSKFKRIVIPPEIFEIDQGSLLKLPIKRGIICKHQFIAIIDYHFNVRDYEKLPKNGNIAKLYTSNNKTLNHQDQFSFSYF